MVLKTNVRKLYYDNDDDEINLDMKDYELPQFLNDYFTCKIKEDGGTYL